MKFLLKLELKIFASNAVSLCETVPMKERLKRRECLSLARLGSSSA